MTFQHGAGNVLGHGERQTSCPCFLLVVKDALLGTQCGEPGPICEEYLWAETVGLSVQQISLDIAPELK